MRNFPYWRYLVFLGVVCGCSPSTPPRQQPLSGETENSPQPDSSTPVAEVGPLPVDLKSLQGPSATNPVQLTLRCEPLEARPAEDVMLELTVHMAPGWHIHGTVAGPGVNFPTTISMLLPDEIEAVGEWESPSPQKLLSGQSSSSGYEGEATFRQSLRVAPGSTTGSLEIACEVGYQPCDDRRCLRPETATVSTTLKVLSD